MLKVIIIVALVILGGAYLKPYVQNVYSSYQELLGAPSSTLKPADLLEQLKKYQQGGN